MPRLLTFNRPSGEASPVFGEQATAPFQAGGECIAHALQALTDLDPQTTVLSVDGVGPFRPHFTRFDVGRPSLNPRRRLCASFRPSVLRQSFIVFVGRQFWGHEQGCPLMPLLFVLGQHRALRSVQSHLSEDERFLAFHDDIYVMSQPERTCELCGILARELLGPTIQSLTPVPGQIQGTKIASPLPIRWPIRVGEASFPGPECPTSSPHVLVVPRSSSPLSQVPGWWYYPVASCTFVRSRHVATSWVPAQWMECLRHGMWSNHRWRTTPALPVEQWVNSNCLIMFLDKTGQSFPASALQLLRRCS